MFTFQNVSAGYGRELVLRNVSANVTVGDFLGLIGPNGSGKTTLLRVMSGVLPPREGEVRLRGRDLRTMRQRDLAKIVAHLLQDIEFVLAFSVRDVVLMGRSPHLPRFGYESQRDYAAARHAMDLTDISHLADRPITEISGGERQRALLAMCLAQEPEVLLLDEPTSHLDIGHQQSILSLIRDLNRRAGITVVAVFHDLNLAAEYCDRVVLLDRGRIAEAGAPEDVITADTIRNIYGARVLVERNPASHRPYVVLAADCCPDEREPAVRPRQWTR